MVKLILFIVFLIACMVWIWFTQVGLFWKILVDVWCASIIWLSIEMHLSPVMNDEDEEEIKWDGVRP